MTTFGVGCAAKNRAAYSAVGHDRLSRLRQRWRPIIATVAAVIAGILIATTAGRRTESAEAEPPILVAEDSTKKPRTAEPPTRAEAEALEKEAVDVVRRLMSTFPQSPTPIRLMGTLYARFDEVEEATRWWNKCLEMAPDRADVYALMADVASKKGEYDESLRLYEKAIELSSSLPDAHRKMARVLVRLGRHEEAVVALKKELAISPHSARAHSQLGQAYRQMAQFEKAKLHYETAIDRQADDTEAHYGLAMTCTRLGQPDEAQQHMKQFKKLKAADHAKELEKTRAGGGLEFERQMVGLVYTEAGSLYARYGYNRTAEMHWRQAAELDPKNHICRNELARLYVRQGSFSRAAGAYEQLAETYPDNPIYHAKLAVVNTQLKRREAALAAIRRAVELAPDEENYRRLQKEIEERQ